MAQNQPDAHSKFAVSGADALRNANSIKVRVAGGRSGAFNHTERLPAMVPVDLTFGQVDAGAGYDGGRAPFSHFGATNRNALRLQGVVASGVAGDRWGAQCRLYEPELGAFFVPDWRTSLTGVR